MKFVLYGLFDDEDLMCAETNMYCVRLKLSAGHLKHLLKIKYLENQTKA